jgi:hypothetical protein
MQHPEQNTEPYQAPDAWVALLRRCVDAERPRVVVSLSAGRSPYRSVLDLSPSVSRVARDDGPELVTLHPGSGYLPGTVLDVAASVYAASTEIFLDQRRGDGSAYVRTGRLRLQVFDGETELGSDSQSVARETLGAPVETVVENATATSEVIRVLEAHARTLGTQFIQLSKQGIDAAANERSGIVEHARAALELGREAGELKAAAAAELASVHAQPFLTSEAGQTLVLVVVEQIPALVGLAGMALKMRADALAARLTAQAQAPAQPAPSSQPESVPVKVEAQRGGARRRRPAKSAGPVNPENSGTE